MVAAGKPTRCEHRGATPVGRPGSSGLAHRGGSPVKPARSEHRGSTPDGRAGAPHSAGRGGSVDTRGEGRAATKASHRRRSADRKERRDAGEEPWRAGDFLLKLNAARGRQDRDGERRVLRTVAKSNDSLRHGLKDDVSRTDRVSRSETKQHLQGHGCQPQYTISEASTGDALVGFAAALQPRRKTVCALNFANGEHPGGGYLNGARAQEEELCREFPSLYTSLRHAKDSGGTYPFGPSTHRGGRDYHRYADVLFTPKLVSRRGSQEQGYRFLRPEESLANMALVSAAAPNLPKGEVFDPDLVKEAMRTIIATPKLKDPSIDTLVLGAWGCGAFGCDPKTMATLFAQVLLREGMGQLYREVHFAIPPGNGNANAFQDALCKCGVPLTYRHVQPA